MSITRVGPEVTVGHRGIYSHKIENMDIEELTFKSCQENYCGSQMFLKHCPADSVSRSTMGGWFAGPSWESSADPACAVEHELCSWSTVLLSLENSDMKPYGARNSGNCNFLNLSEEVDMMLIWVVFTLALYAIALFSSYYRQAWHTDSRPRSIHYTFWFSVFGAAAFPENFCCSASSQFCILDVCIYLPGYLLIS